MWPWELGETDEDVAFAALAGRFGKTLAELDEQPWTRIAPLLEIVKWEARAEQGAEVED